MALERAASALARAPAIPSRSSSPPPEGASRSSSATCTSKKTDFSYEEVASPQATRTFEAVTKDLTVRSVIPARMLAIRLLRPSLIGGREEVGEVLDGGGGGPPPAATGGGGGGGGAGAPAETSWDNSNAAES